MKKTIFTIIALAVVSATSCLKLDFYPHNALSRYDIGENDIEQFYYGLYNLSQYKPTVTGYFNDDIIGGDLQRAGGSSAGMTARDLITNIIYPNSHVGFWSGYYAWLYQVNCFLISANELPDSETKNKYLGTGYFFRGLIYYELTSRWREIPIVSEPTNKPVTKGSEAECWAFTEENFLLAEKLLSNFSGDRTYVSKQAAQALLARTYLAQGKMTKAAEYAEAVIGSGSFSLDSWKNIWEGKVNGNTEVIFCYANLNADEAGIVMSQLFRGNPTYVPTSDFEKNVVTSDERYPYLAYADGQYVTFNKYDTYGGYDPIVITRLSEMYLISAEAKGKAAGLERLNQLKEKRGLSAIAEPATEEKYIDEIIAERRLELASEGFRWFDLVRTGRYCKVMNLPERYTVLPIYEREIELSNGVLVQHPFWAGIEAPEENKQ